jgi:hypothetical protein
MWLVSIELSKKLKRSKTILDIQRKIARLLDLRSRTVFDAAEDAEWEAEKRLEHDADRCCGHDWSNI